MFDIFYSGFKPNLFAHEQHAESIEHAQQLSRTRFFWWITYLCDYSEFDFLWQPVPWEEHQRHAWPSQWQVDSGTYLVPKSGYTDTNYHFSPPKINVIKSINSAYVIDHLNVNQNLGPIYEKISIDKTVRYVDNYFDTLKRIAQLSCQEYVWICSSICDYSDFDFSWYPSSWQKSMLHVFPSGDQKFGDTFFMHVPSFRQLSKDTELLDWYSNLNFCQDQTVIRLPLPEINHKFDSHCDAVKTIKFDGPLALFNTQDSKVECNINLSLWREKTKTITPLSPGSSAVIVPQSAVPYIKTQLYDYPHIDQTHRNMQTDHPVDIVFISNGETNADQHFGHLNSVTYNLTNSLHRVDGVNGRAAAYHAAARASTTPWFFAVFAKLEVNADFDWSWQPDRMQEPKHYIFHARNPVNGLVYGHQAMIAYNRRLVLANDGTGGLDFTLDDAHEVVPMLSGTAYYNTSPWVAWRTAFREILKLRHSLPDVENEYRLHQWLNFDNTDSHVVNESWSRWGAEDAVEYYESVGGDFAALKKSYEWSWLASYALLKRNLSPD